jgi:hypothetical protein
MAYDRFNELHDAFQAFGKPSTAAAESQWASGWGDLRDRAGWGESQPMGLTGTPFQASATARALNHADTSLRYATDVANQCALAAALDKTIVERAAANWELARQRVESCTHNVSLARHAYELKCALPGPASTAALIALTAFRQACSDATIASQAAAHALAQLSRASNSAAASALAARRAAAVETAAVAARNHAISAERATRGEHMTPQAWPPARLRSLQSSARLPEHPSLVREVARSQGFCRGLAGRVRTSV